MAGPWEKYQNNKAPETIPEGPWSKYKAPASNDDALGSAQAGLEHFGNAASFGYMPQIQGLVSQVIPNPSADFDAKFKESGGTINQKNPTYLSERDDYIKHMEQQEKDHPIASAVGTLGGAITSGIATSGLMPIKAASGLGRIKQAARAGAVMGVVSNPGDREGEVSGLQLDERGGNFVKGAAIGAAGQGVIEGLSSAAKGITNIGRSLTNKAEERAFKASGAMLKDYRHAYGQDRINEIGRYMLDNGLVKPGMTVKDIAEAAEKLESTHGKAIGSILDGLDQAGAQAPAHADLAAEIDKIAAPMKGMKTAQPTSSALQDVADDIRAMGEGQGPTFSGAQKVKQFISDQIEKVGGWKTPNPSEKNLALRQAYGAVKESIENAGAKAADSMGDKGLLDNYLAQKSAYRNAADVSRIANDQALRQNANNFFSLGDKLGAGAGFALGASKGDSVGDRLQNGLKGAAIGLGMKAARVYGTPIVSTALDKAGSAISNSVLPEVGKMISPALAATERSAAAPSLVEAIASSPRLERVPLKVAEDGGAPDRKPSQLRGEALWMQKGADKLGLSAEDMAGMSKSQRELLIQAGDLPAGSKRLQMIKNKLTGGK